MNSTVSAVSDENSLADDFLTLLTDQHQHSHNLTVNKKQESKRKINQQYAFHDEIIAPCL